MYTGDEARRAAAAEAAHIAIYERNQEKLKRDAEKKIARLQSRGYITMKDLGQYPILIHPNDLCKCKSYSRPFVDYQYPHPVYKTKTYVVQCGNVDCGKVKIFADCNEREQLISGAREAHRQNQPQTIATKVTDALGSLLSKFF